MRCSWGFDLRLQTNRTIEISESSMCSIVKIGVSDHLIDLFKNAAMETKTLSTADLPFPSIIRSMPEDVKNPFMSSFHDSTRSLC